MSYVNDPVMTIINKNFSYNDRQAVLAAMSESAHSKALVYEGVGDYFLKKMNALNPGIFLMKYLQDRGDITKRKGFDTTMSSLQYLKNDPNMVVSQSAFTVEESLLNLKTRRKEFELGCKNIEHPFMKLLYATISKTCLAATSLLIANASPVGEVSKAKATDIPDCIVGLAAFNKYCKEGSIDKIIRFSLNVGNKVVKEGLLDWSLDTIAAVGTAIITSLRSLVYWVYNTRIDMADYLEHQAMYLELNQAAVKSRTDLTGAQKESIIAKQKKIGEELLKLSDKIQLDEVKAARKAKEQSEKDTRDMTKEDATSKKQESGKDQSVPDFF